MGNERVLRARFNDARFFWDIDLRSKLSDRLEDLKNVTFQAKLGSYFDKTERMVELARRSAKPSGASVAMCARAATLSKCDLPTEMVKELTELQGIVGGLYAREQGEPLEIWRADVRTLQAREHGRFDPFTVTGQVVALADKMRHVARLLRDRTDSDRLARSFRVAARRARCGEDHCRRRPAHKAQRF